MSLLASELDNGIKLFISCFGRVLFIGRGDDDFEHPHKIWVRFDNLMEYCVANGELPRVKFSFLYHSMRRTSITI